jgi:hypothetical protein
MFNLNLVGSRILELFESGSSEGQIATALSHEFNVGVDAVRQDIRDFIEALEKHRLLSTDIAGDTF